MRLQHCSEPMIPVPQFNFELRSPRLNDHFQSEFNKTKKTYKFKNFFAVYDLFGIRQFDFTWNGRHIFCLRISFVFDDAWRETPCLCVHCNREVNCECDLCVLKTNVVKEKVKIPSNIYNNLLLRENTGDGFKCIRESVLQSRLNGFELIERVEKVYDIFQNNPNNDFNSAHSAYFFHGTTLKNVSGMKKVLG